LIFTRQPRGCTLWVTDWPAGAGGIANPTVPDDK